MISKEKIKIFTNSNKEAWDEAMPKHRLSAKEKLDELFSQKGFVIQNDETILNIFKKYDITNKTIAHLCCNNGSELLSLKNMNAGKCFGFDISNEAINEATQRAIKSKIDCEFICCDVYDIESKYYNWFDIVYITIGALGWLPDLNTFFNVVNKLLKEKGIVIIHELHPFTEILPFDGDEANLNTKDFVKIIEPYFRNGPIIENDGIDYVGKTKYESKTTYWFAHSLSDIINGIVSNELKIKEFIESPKDITTIHQSIEKMNFSLPLSMIVVCEKC